jgi:hypothetical protein
MRLKGWSGPGLAVGAQGIPRHTGCTRGRPSGSLSWRQVRAGRRPESLWDGFRCSASCSDPSSKIVTLPSTQARSRPPFQPASLRQDAEVPEGFQGAAVRACGLQRRNSKTA